MGSLVNGKSEGDNCNFGETTLARARVHLGRAYLVKR